MKNSGLRVAFFISVTDARRYRMTFPSKLMDPSNSPAVPPPPSRTSIATWKGRKSDDEAT